MKIPFDFSSPNFPVEKYVSHEVITLQMYVFMHEWMLLKQINNTLHESLYHLQSGTIFISDWSSQISHEVKQMVIIYNTNGNRDS